MQSEPQTRGGIVGGEVIASGSGVLEQGGASRQRLQLKHLQLEGAGNEACLVLYVVIVAHPPETLPTHPPFTTPRARYSSDFLARSNRFHSTANDLVFLIASHSIVDSGGGKPLPTPKFIYVAYQATFKRKIRFIYLFLLKLVTKPFKLTRLFLFKSIPTFKITKTYFQNLKHKSCIYS